MAANVVAGGKVAAAAAVEMRDTQEAASLAVEETVTVAALALVGGVEAEAVTEAEAQAMVAPLVVPQAAETVVETRPGENGRVI